MLQVTLCFHDINVASILATIWSASASHYAGHYEPVIPECLSHQKECFIRCRNNLRIGIRMEMPFPQQPEKGAIVV
jgi:hypothetical protein